MKKKLQLVLVPALIVLFLIGMACSGGNKAEEAQPATEETKTEIDTKTTGAGAVASDVKTSTDPTEATVEKRELQPGEIDYGEPKYGGILFAHPHSPLKDVDPNNDSSYKDPSFNMLLEFDPTTFDRNDIRPSLAESWESNAEGTIYTFKIRDDARYWDGSTVTAEDVAYGWNRVFDRPRVKVSVESTVKAAIDRIEAVDEKTVRFHLTYPWADFILHAAMEGFWPVPKAHYEPLDNSDETYSYDSLNTLMGTGPFKLSKINSKFDWEYVKNPDYWKKDSEGRALPYLDGMHYYTMTDMSAARAAWEAGQVHLTVPNTNANQTAESLKDMIARGQGKFVAYPVYCCQYALILNTTKPPFDKREVRMAINLALHRQPMNELAWGGLGGWGTLMGPPGNPLTRSAEEVLQLPGFREPKDVDIAEAQRLLASAGYPDGFETTVSWWKHLNFEGAAPLVKEQLEKFLNIKTETIVLEQQSFYESRAKGQFNIMFSVTGGGIPGPDKQAGDNIRLTGANNFLGWEYPGLLDLIEEQSRELDLVKRKGLVRQIEDILHTKDSKDIMLFWASFSKMVNVEVVAGLMPGIGGASENKQEHLWLLNP